MQSLRQKNGYSFLSYGDDLYGYACVTFNDAIGNILPLSRDQIFEQA